MTDRDPFDQHPLGAFDNAHDFESSYQRTVRELYDGLEAMNWAKINDFDPYAAIATVDIDLYTGHPEIEDQEPLLAHAKYEAMLRNLGFAYEPLEPDHPDLVFERKYANGSIDQIRYYRRRDGERIPIHTTVTTIEAGGYVDGVSLLSYEQADILTKEFEDYVGEQEVDRRLVQEFNVSRSVLDTSDMTLNDKRKMLDAYDMILELEVAPLDTSALDVSRTNLVVSMMPPNMVRTFGRKRKLEGAQATYEAGIEQLIKRNGLGQEETKGLLLSEQLLRLRELNQQVQRRRHAVKTGYLAIAGPIAGAGAGLGPTVMIIEAATGNQQLEQEHIVSKAFAAGIAIAATMLVHANQFRRRLAMVQPLTDQTVNDDKLDLAQQLANERDRMDDYIRLLRPNG